MKQQTSKNKAFPFMLYYIRKHQKFIYPLILVTLFNLGLQIIAPQILGQFIDTAQGKATMTTVLTLIGSYVAIILLQMGTEVLVQNYSDFFGRRITDQLRLDTLRKFLDAPMKQHDSWSEGEVLTCLDEDVEGLFSYFYILFFNIITSILLLTGILFALVLRNQFIALVMFVICMFTIFIFKWIQDKGMIRYINSSKASARFNGIMKEQLDHALDIRACSAENYSLQKLHKSMKQRYKESFPADMMYSKLWVASTLLDTLSTIITLSVSILLWRNGSISLGTVFLIHQYNDKIYLPLQSFRDNLTGLQSSKAKVIRVIEMFHQIPSITFGNRELSESVELVVNHLNFGYTASKNVLSDINFELKKGEKLAIIGATGCGKTTLISLITRLYEYQSGEIRMNGIPLPELSKHSLRTHIACCSQEVRFLHGTLRDNITLYDDSVSDDTILWAIEQTGLSSWYEKLPDGLDTLLGQDSSAMSSGEAQLVSIVRLFIKDPYLVILDEISSRLDPVTEHHLLTAIDALTKDRTVISIAHREAVIKRCDTILILSHGKMVEYGTRIDLEHNPSSVYHSLMETKEVLE